MGVDGGTLDTDGGVVLDIPAGAVDSNTTITVTENAAPAPTGYPAQSSLYAFGPDGTVFAHPIDVELPLPAGVSNAAIYWSRVVEDGGTIYDNIGGTVANGKVSAQVVHFSSGFVGDPATSRTVSGSQVVTYKTPERI